MLHILWILLKFILILLGILLGLVLLAVLLVLFCPVRYRAAAVKETDSFQETSLSGRVSWLFGAVAAEVSFENGSLGKEIRLFGIPLLKLWSRHQEKKRQKLLQQKAAEKAEKKQIQAKAQEEHEAVETPPKVPDTETLKREVIESMKASETSKASEDAKASGTMSTSENPKASEEDQAAFEEAQETSQNEEQGTSDQQAPEEGFFYRMGCKLRSLLEKIRNFFEKLGMIPKKIHKIKLTAEKIYAKIEWWKCFLTHPRSQEAISLVKDRLIRLLKHIFPTKITGNLTFSCTDPSVTGKILAILGMTIPLHKNCIRVCPVFEEVNRVQGNVKLKGRVYGIVLLVTALEIYFNKNIKFMIKKWKKHKEV